MASDKPPQPRRRVMIHGLTPARPGALSSAPDFAPLAPIDEPSIAENIIPQSRPPFLVGHGYDIHRLKAGKTLTLAGLVIPHDFGPDAHSDGDVILHAITDAILGALALGDIGKHFPDNDPKLLGADSRVFVETAYGFARRSGYRLSNVDVTLMLERPKVSPYRAAMVENLKSFFENSSLVNLKACTNEGLDAIGRGEALAAHAAVLLIAER